MAIPLCAGHEVNPLNAVRMVARLSLIARLLLRPSPGKPGPPTVCIVAGLTVLTISGTEGGGGKESRRSHGPTDHLGQSDQLVGLIRG